MANLHPGLQGFVGIAPKIGGVNITGGQSTLYSDFDFTPGTIVQINANPLFETGENDFLPFNGLEGTISDITGARLEQVNAGLAFENFISVPNAFTFTLEQVSLPMFVESKFATTGQLSAFGTFYDTNGNASSGELNFSADFAGMKLAQVQQLVRSENNFVASWSLNAVATAQPADVPEPSLFIAMLLGSALALINKLRPWA